MNHLERMYRRMRNRERKIFERKKKVQAKIEKFEKLEKDRLKKEKLFLAKKWNEIASLCLVLSNLYKK